MAHLKRWLPEASRSLSWLGEDGKAVDFCSSELTLWQLESLGEGWS